MAYGYPGMYYPSPSVEQIAQQFQNAMGQYQNFQQGQMQQPKQKRCGEYIIVDGFDEVEKTPVRMDGTPTLFICPKEHIAWAKQYSRNGPTCETFPYSSSLTAVSHGPEQPEVDYTKLLDDTQATTVIDTYRKEYGEPDARMLKRFNEKHIQCMEKAAAIK